MVLGNWGHEAPMSQTCVVLAHAGPGMGAEGPLLSVQLRGTWRPPHRVCTVALRLLRLQPQGGHLFQQTEHFSDPHTFPERYTLELRKGPSLPERESSARSAEGSQAGRRSWGAWAAAPCGQVWARCPSRCPSPPREGRPLQAARPGSRRARAWGHLAWRARRPPHRPPGLRGAWSRLRSRSAPRPAAGPAAGPDLAAGRSRGLPREGRRGARPGGPWSAAPAGTARPEAGKPLGAAT